MGSPVQIRRCPRNGQVFIEAKPDTSLLQLMVINE
ncbi:hypothetical protein EV696_101328 [Permianibacter aggregans]|uniref:Uncharacterized protein n=1 Tax=Permianibacter aggregans TaxID=1510150 RepID=A0A4R6V598_9GAMM|nr:hypothetical protein EV696_101328 [Permianibacter aggregans]